MIVKHPVFADAPALSRRYGGLKIFPVNLIPTTSGTDKVPVGGSHGHLDATDDPAQLARWARRYPNLAVGVNCAANRIDVVDDDEHHPFTPTAEYPSRLVLRDVAAQLGCPLDTLIHTSVSGGKQYWFEKTGVPMRGKRRKVGAPVEAFDLKSNGFVVLTSLPDDWRSQVKPMPEPWVEFFAKLDRLHAAATGPSPLPPLRSLSPADAARVRELLLPHWVPGTIHFLSLYLVGALAKAGVSREDAEAFLLSFPVIDARSAPRNRQTVKSTYDKFEAGGDVRGMSGFEELSVEAETITTLDALLFPEFAMWEEDDTDGDSAGGSDGGAADHMPPFPASAWRGLLSDYLALVTPITEAPPAFHYASAVAVIVSVLGDHVKLYDEDPGLLNLYCLLLGSTATKKGTAMSYAVKLFLRRLTCLRTGDCWTIDDVSSGEALIRLLDPTHEPGHSQRLLLEDEAATLLTHTT